MSPYSLAQRDEARQGKAAGSLSDRRGRPPVRRARGPKYLRVNQMRLTAGRLCPCRPGPSITDPRPFHSHPLT